MPLLAAVACLAVLPACQLRPVYSASTGAAATGLLGGVEVSPIPERTGFLVRDQLVSRLAPQGAGAAPRYRLDVTLDDRIEGFGVRGDNTIVRERRTLRARYALVETETGRKVFESVAGADAGIDVVASEYAVVAAEVTASERLAEAIAEQIVGRLAIFARRGS
ncbi:MAG: LPS assembly lipoprotein LptE [Thermaurantiacus tibetensis]|uniref:LPS assembly lipoprotein LptE n=1 Tax=Thermaurantiacus tibetensis TaxID=2759035 RepID=UPI001F213025|nr:LPS assembly lipoprotein LptE [Thermaurantiacus tibetensis]